MKYSPRNITIACDHKGLTHYGGVYFFHEFLRVLQLRHFLSRQLRYRRQNHRYSVSQMILALVYPLVLGLDRLQTASFLRSNGTFQRLTGRRASPIPGGSAASLSRLPTLSYSMPHAKCPTAAELHPPARPPIPPVPGSRQLAWSQFFCGDCYNPRCRS